MNGDGLWGIWDKNLSQTVFQTNLELLYTKTYPGRYKNIGREGYVKPSLEKLTRVHFIFDDRKIIMQKKLNNVKLFDLDI